MSTQRKAKKKQRGCPSLAICMVGLVGLFVLTVVAAGLNPSLKYLVKWSWGLIIVVTVPMVLVQTWILTHPGDCPKCGREMKLPPSHLFRLSSYSDSLRTIKFTCPNCGHVADSGIRLPWAGLP